MCVDFFRYSKQYDDPLHIFKVIDFSAFSDLKRPKQLKKKDLGLLEILQTIILNVGVLLVKLPLTSF